MSLVDDIYGPDFSGDDGAIVVRRRHRKFVGATVADNPAEDRTDITLPGSAGGTESWSSTWAYTLDGGQTLGEVTNVLQSADLNLDLGAEGASDGRWRPSGADALGFNTSFTFSGAGATFGTGDRFTLLLPAKSATEDYVIDGGGVPNTYLPGLGALPIVAVECTFINADGASASGTIPAVATDGEQRLSLILPYLAALAAAAGNAAFPDMTDCIVLFSIKDLPVREQGLGGGFLQLNGSGFLQENASGFLLLS